MERVAPDAVLTIKAPGYSFITMPISLEHRNAARLTVDLAPLSPFERTDDFRSGIGVEGGEAAFLDLAVTSQTELGPAHAGEVLRAPTFRISRRSVSKILAAFPSL